MRPECRHAHKKRASRAQRRHRYEEGDDLDADETAEHALQLPKALAMLPGGGISHNTQLCVTDQTQDMTVTLIVSHQVRSGVKRRPPGQRSH